MTISRVDGNGQASVTITPEDLEVSQQTQAEAVSAAMTALGVQPNLTVGSTNKTEPGEGTAAADGSVPELDDPDEMLAALADLEAFMAYMQMEATEEQIKAAKKRIEELKAELEKCHSEAMEKIENAIKEMKKAEKSAKINRILGWIGVGLAFVAATLTTIFTAGIAGPLAFASAALALTAMILNETGATEKICEAMAKSIASHGDLTKDEAKMAANIIFSSLFMIATLATGVAGGVSAAGSAMRAGIDIAQSTVKLITTVSAVVNCVAQLGGLGGGIAGTVTGYVAALAQADVTEHQMTAEELEKLLQQIQDEFDALVALLNAAIAQLAQLLEARQENEEELAMQIAG